MPSAKLKLELSLIKRDQFVGQQFLPTGCAGQKTVARFKVVNGPYAAKSKSRWIAPAALVFALNS